LFRYFETMRLLFWRRSGKLRRFLGWDAFYILHLAGRWMNSWVFSSLLSTWLTCQPIRSACQLN
jgi:hypothetical protein